MAKYKSDFLNVLASRGFIHQVSEPDDLDKLMDLVATPPGSSTDAHHHVGEHLYMSERVVVSPSSGIFLPEDSLAVPGTGLLPGTGGAGAASRVRGATGPGDAGGPAGMPATVGVGDLIGRVGVSEVRTPFAGQVVRWLSVAGERVQEGQPLAWLRTEGSTR